MEEIDVTKTVFCPDEQMVVDCDDCCGCLTIIMGWGITTSQ
jgi:hypothetical protein